jgi:probable HAF family extracellular repeat protein
MTSSAQDINESGSIVGYAHDVNYPHPNMPVLWSDANTNVKLGEYPGRALAINEAGQVVGGVSMPGEGYIHGFVWDEVNGLRDLTELVSPYQGLEFIGYATDINEAGQIVATARIDGESHAVLLIPFDEIQIDIRPEVYPNTINTRSKTVTVAILSSTSFYAPDDVIVNRLSLTFGPTGDEQSLLSCATRKPKDVNGDTLKDLVCTFSIKDAGFISGDEVGILKGTTETGTSFEGSDEVLITTPRK